jgi:putative aldouronate transport system substrate-binding protein
MAGSIAAVQQRGMQFIWFVQKKEASTMFKSKSFIMMLAIMLVSVAVLAGCGGSNNGGDNNGSSNAGSKSEGNTTNKGSNSSDSKKEESKEPVKLSMFAVQQNQPMETNLFTKKMEEMFNVSIDWELAPSDGLQERKQLALASGDYPEVFLEGKFNKSDLQRYGKQGVLLPLNDLIEQHAPNVKKAFEDVPYLKAAITAPDGNIYGLPRVNECYHCTYSYKFWINKAWLDELGLPLPETTEQFHETLKAFKEKDPNGNGKQDEIPMTGANSKSVWNGNFDAFLMNPFIYNDSTRYLQVIDGKVGFVADQPEWKQGLEFMRKMYSEGLIDPAAFTQNDQALSQLGNIEGDEVIGAFSAALHGYALNAWDPEIDRHKHWVALPPLKGPDGTQWAGYVAGISEAQFALTNKATEEQQIAAIKMMDYFFTEEGTLHKEYSFEGRGWLPAGAEEKDIHGEPAKYTFEGLPEADETIGDRWQLMGPSMMTAEFRDSFAMPQDPDNYEVKLHHASQLYEPFAATKIAYPSSVFIHVEDVDAEAQIRTAIVDYVQSNLAQFITGSKSLDKDWDSYVKGFEGLQLKQYLEIYQRAIEVK